MCYQMGLVSHIRPNLTVFVQTQPVLISYLQKSSIQKGRPYRNPETTIGQIYASFATILGEIILGLFLLHFSITVFSRILCSLILSPSLQVYRQIHFRKFAHVCVANKSKSGMHYHFSIFEFHSFLRVCLLSHTVVTPPTQQVCYLSVHCFSLFPCQQNIAQLVFSVFTDSTYAASANLRLTMPKNKIKRKNINVLNLYGSFSFVHKKRR